MRSPILLIDQRLLRFNFRLVARLLGMLLIIMALSMTVPVAVSLYYADGAQFGLALSALLILMLGLLLRNFLGVNARFDLNEKESFLFTAIIWIVVPLMGALPYLFTSSVTNFTDAAFESFSGFTTTGSSIMPDIEFSGTLQRRLHPRMARNVVLMWTIYVLLTGALFALLMVDGNGFVDSYCTALSTVSTGGFMTHNGGMAVFSNFSMFCITLFMFLSGINLAVLFCFFTGKWRKLHGDEELLRYLLIFVVAVLLCSVAFCIADGGISAFNICFSLFHVASTLSTCGFYTTPPAVWPMTVSVVTFLLIFIGASAGSTGGGLKIKRLMILSRYVRNYFVRMIHPRAVLSVKVNGKVVENSYVTKIFSYVFLYLFFVSMGAFVLTLCGSNIPNAFCMAAANIGNLGPSPVINNLGASLDYVQLMPVAKWTMMLLMLAGRLEIFAVVAVLMPAYWRRRN